MRILLTGHRGYIGSVMVPVLRHAHYEVAGLDSGVFEGCDFGRTDETVQCFDMDVRDIEFTDLLSFDAVVHLASYPVLGSDPSEIQTVNEQATLHLADCCKRANVSRFLFASTCEVYGRGGPALCDEHTPVDPLTPGAVSKHRLERSLAAMADRDFTPVFLRHASVYGVSPRFRIDLPVHSMVASAVADQKVVVEGNGLAWRPFIHVEDLCRTYAAVLSAPDEAVSCQVLNVAAPGENHRMVEIADLVAELTPGCSRSIERKVFDEASYRVDPGKLQRLLPDLTFRWTLAQGIRQLRTAMLGTGFTPGDMRSDRYRREERLESMRKAGQVDSAMRRRVAATV